MKRFLYITFLLTNLCFYKVYSQTIYINGYIKDTNLNPVKDVNVEIYGNSISSSSFTDENGYYEFKELSSGTYTIKPSKKGYIFSPETKIFFQLDSNRENENFTAILLTYRITGFVKTIEDNTVRSVEGVTILLSGDKTESRTSDLGGYYEFSGLLPGNSYTIRPEKLGYGFSPYNYYFDSIDSDQIDKDFYAQHGLTFTIEGEIKDTRGLPLENIAVNIGGDATGKIKSDFNGKYKFENLIADWNYWIYPKKEGAVFIPEKRFFNSLDSDKTAQNFIEREPGYSQDTILKPVNNLFNPEKGEITTIFYKIEKDGPVILRIHSIDGKIIKNLTDTYFFKGTYYSVWDGTDNKNSIVCPGTYIVNLHTDYENIFKKILVVR